MQLWLLSIFLSELREIFIVRAIGQILLRCTANWTQDQRERIKAWFSHVGKIPGDRGFYFLPTVPDLYWILATRLSQILPIFNLSGNGKCVKNWNLRDRGTGAGIFRGLVKSEIHCRRPRRYKFEFSFIGNDRQPSQSGTHLENRDAPDSPDLVVPVTSPNDRGCLRVEFS